MIKYMSRKEDASILGWTTIILGGMTSLTLTFQKKILKLVAMIDANTGRRIAQTTIDLGDQITSSKYEVEDLLNLLKQVGKDADAGVDTINTVINLGEYFVQNLIIYKAISLYHAINNHDLIGVGTNWITWAIITIISTHLYSKNKKEKERERFSPKTLR